MVMKWYTQKGMVAGSQAFGRTTPRRYAVYTAIRRSMFGISSLEEENHRITFFKMGKRVDLPHLSKEGESISLA